MWSLPSPCPSRRDNSIFPLAFFGIFARISSPRFCNYGPESNEILPSPLSSAKYYKQFPKYCLLPSPRHLWQLPLFILLRFGISKLPFLFVRKAKWQPSNCEDALFRHLLNSLLLSHLLAFYSFLFSFSHLPALFRKRDSIGFFLTRWLQKGICFFIINLDRQAISLIRIYMLLYYICFLCETFASTMLHNVCFCIE